MRRNRATCPILASAALEGPVDDYHPQHLLQLIHDEDESDDDEVGQSSAPPDLRWCDPISLPCVPHSNPPEVEQQEAAPERRCSAFTISTASTSLESDQLADSILPLRRPSRNPQLPPRRLSVLEDANGHDCDPTTRIERILAAIHREREVIAPSSRRIPTPIPRMELAVLDKTFVCSICQECVYEFQKYVLRDCGHTFCKLCCTAYLQSRVREGIYDIRCPYLVDEGMCGETVDVSDIVALLACSQYNAKMTWFERYQRFSMLKDPLARECPSCERIVLMQDSSNPRVRCICGEDFCERHSRAHDAEETCEQYESRLRNIEKFTGEEIRKTCKKCPRCGAQTFKNEGCNHMTCPCGQHWCWICNSAINGANGVMDHYGELGECPDLQFVNPAHIAFINERRQERTPARRAYIRTCIYSRACVRAVGLLVLFIVFLLFAAILLGLVLACPCIGVGTFVHTAKRRHGDSWLYTAQFHFFRYVKAILMIPLTLWLICMALAMFAIYIPFGVLAFITLSVSSIIINYFHPDEPVNAYGWSDWWLNLLSNHPFIVAKPVIAFYELMCLLLKGTLVTQYLEEDADIFPCCGRGERMREREEYQ